MPESVRVSFHSFLDIRKPSSYTAPDASQLLQAKVQSPEAPCLNFMEWWKIREGEILGEPFDVCDELPKVLVHFLKMVCTLLQLLVP